MNRRKFPKPTLGQITVLIIMMLAVTACQPANTPLPTIVPTTAVEPPAAATATAAPTATTAPVPAAATPVIPETGSAQEPVLTVAAHPALGNYLVDGKGMALYMFTKDEPNKSNCAGGCLAAWPPLLTQGSPAAGDGVDASLIGTADMPDGTKIVTYNKMPLYYWAADTQPGQTTGQGVNDVWYLVSPQGEPLGMPSAASDAGVTVLNKVTDMEFGEILVDGAGMTLYMFTKGEPNKSNCTGGCLAAWPPFLAEGEVQAGPGVDLALIGTADMPDGSKIVTYNQMPLYYWAADRQPGQTSGQGVNDVWYVVSPKGNAVVEPVTGY